MDDLWQRMSEAMQEEATEICGKTKGGSPRNKDTRWWDEQVQRTLKSRKAAYKALKDGTGDQVNYK